MNSELKSVTRNIDVDPDNLGAFIGPKGSNYKKMIKEIKTKLIGSQPSSDEWSSLIINLKFDTKNGGCVATLSCKEEYFNTVFDIINKFVIFHKKKMGGFQNKMKTLVYRVGKPHELIPRMIGIGGCNVLRLRQELAELPGITSVGHISIEKQEGKIKPPFTNLGDRGSFETILVNVKFKGEPQFKDVHKIVKNYVDHNTTHIPGYDDPYTEYQDTKPYTASDPESESEAESEPEPEPEPEAEPEPEPESEQEPEPESEDDSSSDSES